MSVELSPSKISFIPEQIDRSLREQQSLPFRDQPESGH